MLDNKKKEIVKYKNMESFESRLHRIGYKFKTSNIDSNKGLIDAEMNELIIKTTRTKLVTGILLAIVGVIFMSTLIGPFEHLMSVIKGLEFEGSRVVTLTNFAIGIFGIICFYRGLYRLFEYRGVQVKVSDGRITVKRSEELKLIQYEIINPTDLSCVLVGNEIVISCLDQNGNRRKIFQEKNSISDCLPILDELTSKIEGRIINKIF